MIPGTTGNINRLMVVVAESARRDAQVPTNPDDAYVAGFQRCYQLVVSNQIPIARGDYDEGGFYEDCEPALVPAETPFDMPVRRCYTRGGRLFMEL